MDAIRTCAVCRRTGKKSEMIRIAKSDTIAVDPTQTLPGRGTYVCRDAACVKAAVVKKALNRALKCNVPSQVYRDLEACFDGNETDEKENR